MIDPNLFRWIALSVNSFFDSNKSTYALYFEGQEIVFPTAQVVNPTTSLSTVIPNTALNCWSELHVSTLDITEQTSGRFEADMILTLMGTALYTLDDTLLKTMTGYFANLMTGCVPVQRFGINQQDDASLVGTFAPRGKTKTIQWGAVQLNLSQGPLRVKQESVEQLYHLNF